MHSIGKSQARARFLKLVDAVVAGSGAVAITDRGKVKAVLLSHEDYARLLAQARSQPSPRRSPVGTVEVLEDLEYQSDTASASLLESIERRASQP